jgi:hypothetical protein
MNTVSHLMKSFFQSQPGFRVANPNYNCHCLMLNRKGSTDAKQGPSISSTNKSWVQITDLSMLQRITGKGNWASLPVVGCCTSQALWSMLPSPELDWFCWCWSYNPMLCSISLSKLISLLADRPSFCELKHPSVNCFGIHRMYFNLNMID